jgi:hypothetical protein
MAVGIRKTASIAMILMLCGAQGLQAKPYDIWFCPTRPAVQADGRHTGSTDYDQLFAPNAPWQKAAGKVSVFQTYASFIANTPVDQLKTVMKFLADHDMKLAMEYGPMNHVPGKCYVSAEGWGSGGAKNAGSLTNKIKAAGGTLDYVVMDEEFWNGRIKPPAHSCVATPEDMAENAKLTVDAVHAIFAQTQFGDVEPVQPAPGVNLVSEYGQWLDAWQKVTGTPMAFFHMDVLWDSAPNNMIADIGRMTRARHVAFGIIYNGYTHDTNTVDWLAHARQRYLRYEQAGDPMPDQPVLQSWNFFPDHVLPETDPTAHTHQILDYAQHRGG